VIDWRTLALAKPLASRSAQARANHAYQCRFWRSRPKAALPWRIARTDPCGTWHPPVSRLPTYPNAPRGSSRPVKIAHLDRRPRPLHSKNGPLTRPGSGSPLLRSHQQRQNGPPKNSNGTTDMEMDQYPAAHRTDWNPGKISEPVAREKASYSYDSGVWFGSLADVTPAPSIRRCSRPAIRSKLQRR
jgi:hypothetical protein